MWRSKMIYYHNRYKLKTFEKIGKLHTYAINDLLLIDNKTLLSCSTDSSIKVWQI